MDEYDKTLAAGRKFLDYFENVLDGPSKFDEDIDKIETFKGKLRIGFIFFAIFGNFGIFEKYFVFFK